MMNKRLVAAALAVLGFSVGLSSAQAKGGSAGMVQVPAGKFTMGCNKAEDRGCNEDQGPKREVTLKAFEIDVYETTQGMWEACIKAKACTRPRQSYQPTLYPLVPVTYVSWDQANAYCKWAGKRLPTEAEWEKAARGTDARIFPWGNGELDCKHANYGRRCGADSSSSSLLDVNKHPKGVSPYGAHNMLGNAAEWVADWYALDYAKAGTTDPTGPAKGDLKVFRGASWAFPDPQLVRVTYRYTQEPDNDQDDLGFRCAK
jgi:formylglycine-generating enzyme required for sulfatase activity